MILPPDQDQDQDPLTIKSPPPPPPPPPPSFTPYSAEFSLSSSNNIVSHDPHLNNDGEALYRFLLQQALIPPSYRVSCTGTHTETHSRWVTVEHNGKSETRQESYTETITDFDFAIDIGQLFLSINDDNPSISTPPIDPVTGLPIVAPAPHPREIEPILFSVPDFEPTYRGSMVKQVLAPDPTDPSSLRTRQATTAELNAHKRWAKERAIKGMPPWVTLPNPGSLLQDHTDYESPLLPSFFPRNPSIGLNPPSTTPLYSSSELTLTPESSSPLLSSLTPRQWADAYCASPKLLKEFTFHKVPYGFNTQSLSQHIRSLIASSPYSGRIAINFQIHGDKVYVRPDHAFSRMLSKWWVKALLWICLLYPFVWLFKRFHHLGGGRWEVCGGAYALKRWVPLDTPPSDLKHPPPPPVASSSSSTPRTVETPTGTVKLLGTREGEWLRAWSPTILRAVVNRYQSKVPLTVPGDTVGSIVGAHVFNDLDGF